MISAKANLKTGEFKLKILLLVLCLMSFSAYSVSENFIESYQGSITATTTSTQILPAKKTRNYLLIVNNGDDSVLVKMGSVHTSTEGVLIGPGGSWEPFTPPNGSIWIKSSATTSSVYILEGKSF